MMSWFLVENGVIEFVWTVLAATEGILHDAHPFSTIIKIILQKITWFLFVVADNCCIHFHSNLCLSQYFYFLY